MKSIYAMIPGILLTGFSAAAATVFQADLQGSPVTASVTESVLNAGTATGGWTVGDAQESEIRSSGGSRALMADKGPYDYTAHFPVAAVFTNGGVTVALDAYLRRVETDDSRKRHHSISGYDSLGNAVFKLRINSSDNLALNGRQLGVVEPTGTLTWLGNPGDVNYKSSDTPDSSKFQMLTLTLNTSSMDISYDGVSVGTNIAYYGPGSTHVTSLRFVGAGNTGAFYDNVSATATETGPATGWPRTSFLPYNTQGENMFHITTADFDGVGAKDYVVGMSLEGKVIAFQRPDLINDPAADNRLWEVQTPCSFNIAVSAGEADSTSPGDEILVPGTDGHLRILSSTGSLLSDWAIGDGAMYCAGVGKNASGDIRIVTGGIDGYLRVLDESGTVLHEQRPGKWGCMKFVAVGNFDGVGGDEAIMFHQYGGFFSDDRFVVLDLDTLARPAYWPSGVHYSAGTASHVYDMDGDGDDELVGEWGVLHPENGAPTNQIPAMLPAGEALSLSDYEDFAESPKMSYAPRKSIPGNFRDWTNHPGPELARSRGHALYLANYDTNRLDTVDRLRVTDYGYAHQLYHFMSIARLEDRNGGLDRLVLSGVSNGDDHFYVVDLNGHQWKSDAKYIDGRGVLGAVSDTYDALDADIQAFSGTEAQSGKPIWYVGSFASSFKNLDKTDPVKVAEFADGVEASISNFNARIFGPGVEPQRVYTTTELSLNVDGNDVEFITTNEMINATTALAQRGVHWCMKIGHGEHTFVDPDYLADMFEASIVDGHCYMMARSRELSYPGDIDSYKPHLDALLARAASLGVEPPKVMLCQKGAMWSIMTPEHYDSYFPAYKDIIIPGVENSNVTEQDWTIAERAGLWLHGDVEEWGCNSTGDHMTPNREVISSADMRNGHVMMRHMLSQYALGATIFRITSLQNGSNPLYELDGIGPEWSSVHGQGIYPFLRLVESGIYPNGPDRSRLKGISPLAVALDDHNTGRLEQLAYNREFKFYVPSTSSYALDKVACWDAYTDVPDVDLTAIMYNTKRRWHALLPNSAAGFVPLIPSSDRAEVESNAWCTVAYQTDGDTWSDFADLGVARDTLRTELMSVRSNMLFYVDGECFWQLTEEQNDPDTLFAVVMDSSVLTPIAREVELKKGAAEGVWEVYDQLGSSVVPLGVLESSSDTIPLSIPAGAVRLLVLKKLPVAQSTVMGIAWDGAEAPALAMNGIDGWITPSAQGIRDDGNSTDGTFGDRFDGAAISPKSVYDVRGAEHSAKRSRISVAITNNTEMAVDLDALVFDYAQWLNSSPTNISLSYLSGDLAVPNNTPLATFTVSGSLSKVDDYNDFAASLTNLTDYTLAPSEHAVFRLEASNATGQYSSGGIDNVSIAITAAENYDVWAAKHGLYGFNAWNTADLEPDGVDNAKEYLFGGDPNVADASTVLPSFGIDGSWFDYVYRRRTDYQARGLTYTVEATTNLVSGTWSTDSVIDIGVGSIDSEMDSVTNRISSEELPEQFMRLRVE